MDIQDRKWVRSSLSLWRSLHVVQVSLVLYIRRGPFRITNVSVGSVQDFGQPGEVGYVHFKAKTKHLKMGFSALDLSGCSWLEQFTSEVCILRRQLWMGWGGEVGRGVMIKLRYRASFMLPVPDSAQSSPGPDCRDITGQRERGTEKCLYFHFPCL